jgi:prefoldin subunit 5
MATINQELRERKKALRQLRVSLRRVDSQVELLQRKLAGLIARKLKVPEAADYQKILDGIKAIDLCLGDLVSVAGQIQTLFNW